jgi:hypothetical protein
MIVDDFLCCWFDFEKMMTPTPEPDAICRKRKNA